MTRAAAIQTSSFALPPWPVALICSLILIALGAISWPGFSGPCKDYRLNRALYAAAGNSFAPDKLSAIEALDLHRVKVRSFEGLQACPNLARLRIHEASADAWRTWADSQFPEADPLTPDRRPTLPLLPKLKEVALGPPSD